MTVLADTGPLYALVDATIIAMAERLRVREVLTPDRRHLGTIRARHVRHLTLVP